MITVTADQIPVENTIKSIRHPEAGAVMSYLGTVRSYLDDKRSKGLSFEVADADMYRELGHVEREVLQRFDIRETAIVHRTGSFDVGDDILLIAVSAGHRGPAFEACAYIVDRIKDLHEVWKREEVG